MLGPVVGLIATPVTTTAHTRDPFAPHFFLRAWRQRSPHHGHPQRAPSRSLRPLTSRLVSVQPVLGSELQSFQQLCGAPAAFFCAHAQVAWRGVAWRGVWRGVWRVACFGPLNPLGPSGNIPCFSSSSRTSAAQRREIRVASAPRAAKACYFGSPSRAKNAGAAHNNAAALVAEIGSSRRRS